MLSAPGTERVEGKVLLVLNNLTVALLRFAPEGHIPEVICTSVAGQEGEYPTDVICLEGGGFTRECPDTWPDRKASCAPGIQSDGRRTRNGVYGQRPRR